MSRHNHQLHFHLSKKKRITLLDKVVSVAAFLYPLSGVPQIISVYNGHTDGVSLTAWFGFIIFSLLFFVYGSIHKIKPIIVTNFLWLIVDGLVVIGILGKHMLLALR